MVIDIRNISDYIKKKEKAMNLLFFQFKKEELSD